MDKEYLEALEAIVRHAVREPITAAHWRTVEAVAKLVRLAKEKE